MTSTRNPLQDFILTPQQQNLLFAALNSNKPSASQSAISPLPSSIAFDGSPVQAMDGLGSLHQSPDLDFDYDQAHGDSGFDFSFNDADEPRMIGDLPGTSGSAKSSSPDGDSPDKRSHPDDDEEEQGGAKRREGEEKVAKKPGRKPLTTEPSSKRKAQNRAAQRAFRERKEKHVKDLETKVQELEKASEAANHENDVLRAKVDKMTVELNEYKKRVALIASNRPAVRVGSAMPFGAAVMNNINDVNFQFEFPKFGSLPGPPTGNGAKRTSPAAAAATAAPISTRNNSGQLSPTENSRDGISPSNSASYSHSGPGMQSGNEHGNFSAAALFHSQASNGDSGSNSNYSLDSHYNMGGGATTSSSPSASSNSNAGGPGSSCGTSPEPYTQSPKGFRPVDTLSTIGEEQSNLNGSSQDLGHFANVDMNDFSWLPQADFQFEPNLFGNYRDPVQESNPLANGFDDTFFNDAFDMDFVTPYNLPMTSATASQPTPAVAAAPKKHDLMAEIENAKNEDDTIVEGSGGQLLTCNKIWEKLQNCPKVQSGDFDLDGLCSDLQKKAKCSGNGAVVDEKEFVSVMSKYLGKDSDKTKSAADAECLAAMTKV